MQKITPFLWFDGNAEEAAEFYVSIFEDAKIVSVSRYGKDAPFPEGSVMTVEFRLRGQTFVALNGGPQFRFTEAVSFAVECETQEEVDDLWARLSEGGEEEPCGWLKDKYGLSWQVVPRVLVEMLRDEDGERAGRVMQAVLQMRKIDIAALERAHAGE